MELNKIDLGDWTLFGEGGQAYSYYSKSDDSLMLKLYKKELVTDDLRCPQAEKEFLRAGFVHNGGIPSAKVHEMVTDGTLVGIVFERIKDKVSLCTAVSRDPSRLDECAAELARLARILHSTECDTSLFDNKKQVLYGYLSSMVSLPKDMSDRLASLIGSLRDVTTCLHGDLQFGNAILSGGRGYLIDFGEVCYGDPILDIAECYLASYFLDENRQMEIFHLPAELHRALFRRFLELYYEKSSEETETLLPHLRELTALNIMVFGAIQIAAMPQAEPQVSAGLARSCASLFV